MLSWTAKHKRLTIVLGIAFLAIVVIGASFFIPLYGEICSKNEYTNAKDCASYHVAFVALWQIIKATNDYGAAIAALGTIAIACFTFTLWRSTERLWVAGERQFVVTRRPWMTLLKAQGGTIKVGPNDVTVFVNFTLKNAGNSPAMAVQIFSEIFVYTETERSAGPQIERIIQSHPEVRGGATYFPGDERLEGGTHGVRATRAAITAGYPQGSKVHAAIIGCIFYRFAFEEGQHYTPFHLPALGIPVAEGQYSLNGVVFWDMPTHVRPT